MPGSLNCIYFLAIARIVLIKWKPACFSRCTRIPKRFQCQKVKPVFKAAVGIWPVTGQVVKNTRFIKLESFHFVKFTENKGLPVILVFWKPWPVTGHIATVIVALKLCRLKPDNTGVLSPKIHRKVAPNSHSWGLKFHHAQHPTCPSMVLPETYRACFVSPKLKKKRNIFYSTTELSLLFRLLWMQWQKHGKTGLPGCTR